MHSDRDAAYLREILHNIHLAESFISGLTVEAFEHDTLRLYAAIRALEIISEASRRLSDDLKERHPQIAWREMAAAGNIYRHVYENVAARRVWETVRTALPELRAAIEKELAQPG